MPDVNPVIQLPACHNCHQRKIKCDSRRPKCNACEKGDSDCFILVNQEQISRQYIHALEEKERALRAEIVEELDQSDGSRDHPTEPSFIESSHTPSSSSKPPNFVEGSGLSFLKSLFTDVEWRENNANLLQNLARISPVAEATVQPNLLPSADDTRILFETYLEGSHIQNPFLLRQDVLSLHGRVYSGEVVVSHDLFRTFMICAIGSVNLHRSGVHTKHPFGYYLAAMQHFDQEFLSKEVGAIQDLLLICRFAIYHHIGASIWDITQLCIRMCIEQELHRNSHMNMSLLQEQLRRRVFWECYMIDRYSSMTLDRPFAIADRDIEVNFPAEANDEEVVAASRIFPSLEDFCAMYSPVGTNEMSVFFHCVRLRQVTSKIHSEFSPLVLNDAVESQSQAILATGEIYTKLDRLLLELEQWRQAGPVVNQPRCLYERLEYYDLLHSRERLVLIRKAIDLVPKRNSLPPKDLLLLCLESAAGTVLLYSDLFQRKHITYTRSYFQMLFTAGLSIMSCLSAVADLGKPSAAEPMKALSVCEQLLQFMGTQLPDARHYTIVFEALHRNVSRKSTNVQLPHKGLISTNLPEIALPNPSQAEQSHENYLPGEEQQTHVANSVLASGESLMHNSHSSSNLYPTSSDWLTSPQNGSTQYHLAYSGFQSEDVSQWAFLNDGTLWDMEVGLGEYAYGDPGANANLFNGLDFDFS